MKRMSSVKAPAAVVMPVSTVSVMSLETSDFDSWNTVFARVRKRMDVMDIVIKISATMWELSLINSPRLVVGS